MSDLTAEQIIEVADALEPAWLAPVDDAYDGPKLRAMLPALIAAAEQRGRESERAP